MALETVRVSDKSRAPIPEGTGARIRIMFYDGTRPDRRADLTDEEVAEFIAFTQEVETRPHQRGPRRSRADA